MPNGAFCQDAIGDENLLQPASIEKLTAIHRYLLDIYLKTSKHDDASQEYEYLLMLRPHDPELNFEYGRFLERTAGRTTSDRGIPFLEKAFVLEPTNTKYSHTLAGALLRAKQWSKFHELNKTIHLMPASIYGYLWRSEWRKHRRDR